MTSTHDLGHPGPAAMGAASRRRIGLGLATVLGLIDVVSVIGPTSGDAPGPPAGALAVGAVLGVVTIAAVAALRSRSTLPTTRIIVASRVASLALAAPAFVVAGVPGYLQVGVAVFAAATAVALWCLLSTGGTAR